VQSSYQTPTLEWFKLLSMVILTAELPRNEIA
jgi:hypothetical protein